MQMKRILPCGVQARLRWLTAQNATRIVACSLALGLAACAQGFSSDELAQRAAAPTGPSAGQSGSAGRKQIGSGAGCENCAGSTLPVAGIGTVGGRAAGGAGSAARAGTRGAAGVAAAGRSGAAGNAGSGNAGGSGAGGRSGASGTGSGVAGSGGSGASGAGSGASGRGGRGGSAGAAGMCQTSSCPDCSGLERPCCTRDGMCGCTLLLGCN
jgi:hypothetical protein